MLTSTDFITIPGVISKKRPCGAWKNLLSSVEDGAVAGSAQHVLVQAALTPLALRPKCPKLALQLVHGRYAALVDFALLREFAQNNRHTNTAVVS